MSTVSTAFPDQTYSSSNKPSVETLKADIQALETAHNDLQDSVVSASATVAGLVELATTAETTTGTDATRAVTPDGLHDMTSLSGAAWLKDEDNMASDSATTVPSQQSVKAYVDNSIATQTSKSYVTPTIATPTIKTWDGWNTVTDSWSYDSATTINVPSGAASLYKKGDKFKLTANSVVLYGYIVTVADTLLTVAGNALTNHAFSSIGVSHGASPIGFPDYFEFAGAASGMTSITETHKFSLNGTVCTIQSVVSGTGSTTNRGMTLPIAAKEEVRMNAYVINNGTTATGRAETTAGSTSLTLWRLIDGSNWTASGSSSFHVSMSYIIN